MSVEYIFFVPGFQWAGTFVKRANYQGRFVSFRLSPQLVANCLEPMPGVIGPVKTVEAQETIIEVACRRAIHRFSHASTVIDLRKEDFQQAA